MAVHVPYQQSGQISFGCQDDLLQRRKLLHVRQDLHPLPEPTGALLRAELVLQVSGEENGTVKQIQENNRS